MRDIPFNLKFIVIMNIINSYFLSFEIQVVNTNMRSSVSSRRILHFGHVSGFHVSEMFLCQFDQLSVIYPSSSCQVDLVWLIVLTDVV